MPILDDYAILEGYPTSSQIEGMVRFCDTMIEHALRDVKQSHKRGHALMSATWLFSKESDYCFQFSNNYQDKQKVLDDIEPIIYIRCLHMKCFKKAKNNKTFI